LKYQEFSTLNTPFSVSSAPNRKYSKWVNTGWALAADPREEQSMRTWLNRFLVGLLGLPALAMASTQTLPNTVAYQWHTFFGGDSAGQNKPATALDAYGNLYVAGYTVYPWDKNGNPGPLTFNASWGYLTKISPTGQLLWSQFYENIGLATAIALDPEGNVYLAGQYAGTAGCWVMETDPNGTVFSGPTSFGSNYYPAGCAAYGIAYDAVHGYAYVTGGATGWWAGAGTPINGLPSDGANAMFIAQVPAGVGSVLGWVGFYYSPLGTGSFATHGGSITIDADSNLLVAGDDTSNVAVWKVSNTGALAWEQIFGPGYSFAVAADSSRNVYATGYSGGGWNGPTGQSPLNAFAYGGNYICCRAVAFVLELDTGGNYLWHTFYNGNAQQTIGEGIALDGDSTVYVTGPGDVVGYNNAAPLHDTASTGGGGHFLLKLNNYGAYQWHTLYGIPRYDEANSIAVDAWHNVYVSGWSWGTWNGDGDTPPLHPSSMAPSAIFVSKFGTGTPTATTTTAGSVTPIAYSPSAQTITLSASITGASGGTVMFNLLGTTVPAAVISGVASIGFAVPGATAPGSYTIQATYNPGAGFAASNDSSQSLAISKATPVLTWPSPAGMLFGSALSSTQLNATANVPGAFVYNPPAGTVLSAGSQTLSVVFTPNDTTDYTTAAKSVLVNVTNPAPPASPVQIVVTKILARNGSGQVVATLSVSNSGGTAAQNVQLTIGKIGSTAAVTSLPLSLGTVAGGTTVNATLIFPASVGASGTASTLTIGGTYTGGSFSGT
jgi:hypothetical protein